MKRLLLHIIFLCSSNIIVAQQYNLAEPINAQNYALEDSSSYLLPSLNVLINSALQYSPLLKAKKTESDQIYQEIKIEKKKWMDYIYIEGASDYGMFDQVVINGQTSNDESYSGMLTQSEQIHYYGGIKLKIPISSITSRKNEVKIKRLGIEKINYEIDESVRIIKLLVIDEYYQLKYLEESMHTYQSIYQTLDISYLKAIKDLENGKTRFEDFALLVTTRGKTKDSYLKAKNSFYAQYNKLQLLTGVNF